MSFPRNSVPSPYNGSTQLQRPGPSVPDPSMFFPENFTATTNPQQNTSFPSSLPPAPLPSQPPPEHLLRPQSDFSRVFYHTEATLFLQGSDTTPQFEMLERHIQFNSTDITTPKKGSYLEQQTRMVFPHPTQPFDSPRGPVRVPNGLVGSSSSPSLPVSPDQQHIASPNLHPDLVQVLTWQNDQLKKLQDQVAALLAASPNSQSETPPASGPSSNSNTASPNLRRTKSSNNMVNNITTNTVSTNTSTLWPDIQRGLERLQLENEDNERETVNLEDLRKSQVQVSRDESNASPQPSIHLDLPEYQESPGEGGQRGQPSMTRSSSASWSSPVLGESVSMYEEGNQEEGQGDEDVAQLYQNILGQVKRLLSKSDNPSPTPVTERYVPSPPTISKAPPAYTAAAPPSSPPPDNRAATIERLRQMGVSFISPEDVSPSSASAPAPYSSVYLPRAAEPSKSLFQDSETSLDINSLALKYLNDEELSSLAVRHQAAQGRKQVTWGSVPSSQDGNELSMASHQFLARHGLTDQPVAVADAAQSPQDMDANTQNRNQEVTKNKHLFIGPPQRNQEIQHVPLPFPPSEQIHPGGQHNNHILQRPVLAGLPPVQALGPPYFPRNQRRGQVEIAKVLGPQSSNPGLFNRPNFPPAPGPTAPNYSPGRVLDITAIKQQPKLL